MPCTRTIPGTGAISVVWKGGKTGTLASGSPSVADRDVTFTPSTAVGGDDDTGSAVYEIVVTDNGIALNRYTITVTTYAAGQAPATATTSTPTSLYKIEFLGEADGVVKPGAYVGVKLTRVDGMSHDFLTESISINGLSFQAARRIYYADDTRQVAGAGDPDSKPDVRLHTVDIGRVLRATSVLYARSRSLQGLPDIGARDISLNEIARNACYEFRGTEPNSIGDCGSGSRKNRGQPGTVGYTLEIVVPPGTPPGEYVVTVKGYRSLTDRTIVTETRTLTVGSPPSATTVSFGLSSPRRAIAGDVDTTPKDGYADDVTTMEPSTIAAGGADNQTELTLSVLNANSKPASASAVSSIVVTTTLGTLTAKSGQTPTCAGGGACAFDLSALETSGGLLPEKIRVLLTSPSLPGIATVTATVVSGGQVFRPDPVQVRFSGPPTSLNIGAASGNVLGYHVGDDVGDTGMDARDQITFMLDATDASGSAVKVPTLSATVRNSGGAIVAQSNYETTQSGSMMNQLMLDIDAAITSALAAGTYTLEITSGALKATTTFLVVGAAYSVELTLEPMHATQIGQSVIATATVTDADGNAVADGTTVMFDILDLVGDIDAVAVLDETSTTMTRGGKVSVTLTVVGAGRAVVRAIVPDDATPERNVAVLVSTAGAPKMPAAEASLDCLSALSGFAAWTCDVASTASELFGLVSGRGVTAVHLWNGSAWVRYSVVDGTMVPGSSDFAVARSDILYISN